MAATVTCGRGRSSRMWMGRTHLPTPAAGGTQPAWPVSSAALSSVAQPPGGQAETEVLFTQSVPPSPKKHQTGRQAGCGFLMGASTPPPQDGRCLRIILTSKASLRNPNGRMISAKPVVSTEGECPVWERCGSGVEGRFSLSFSKSSALRVLSLQSLFFY